MPRTRKEEFLRINAIDIYGHGPAQEPLTRGLWNLQLGGHFLGHHYYILSLAEPCSRVEKFLRVKFHFDVQKGLYFWFFASFTVESSFFNICYTKNGTVFVEWLSNRSLEWLGWPRKLNNIIHNTLCKAWKYFLLQPIVKIKHL